MKRGIDISDNQTITSWPDVYKSLKNESEGEEPFVVIKLTEGNKFADPTARGNIRLALAAGFKNLAVYHFGRADIDGTLQGEFFAGAWHALVGIVPGISLLDGTVVKAFYDLEDTPSEGSVWEDEAKATRVARIGHTLAFMDDATGVATGIYTSGGWFNGDFSGTDWHHRPLWLARWGAEAPGTCGLWPSPLVWQYSASGTVRGIEGSGNVDLDVLHPAVTS
jgi:GH25 family lysozyme M1 (1,4-beta-N-acetylmuramidase)